MMPMTLAQLDTGSWVLIVMDVLVGVVVGVVLLSFRKRIDKVGQLEDRVETLTEEKVKTRVDHEIARIEARIDSELKSITDTQQAQHAVVIGELDRINKRLERGDTRFDRAEETDTQHRVVLTEMYGKLREDFLQWLSNYPTKSELREVKTEILERVEAMHRACSVAARRERSET